MFLGGVPHTGASPMALLLAVLCDGRGKTAGATASSRAAAASTAWLRASPSAVRSWNSSVSAESSVSATNAAATPSATVCRSACRLPRAATGSSRLVDSAIST